MDINEIKKIIEKDKGKFIIVENGEPIMVITSFEEYKKKLLGVKPPEESEESEGNELKVEDLPL